MRPQELRLQGTRLVLDDLYCREGDQMRAVPGVAQIMVMEAEVPVLVGDRLRFRARLHPPSGFHNPGGLDWERKAASDGIAWMGTVESADWILKVADGHLSVLRLVDRWRQWVSAGLMTIEDPIVRGSAVAMVLGHAGLLPPDFSDGLRWLGIIHLYVISGLHIAVVAWGLYHLAYWLFSRRARWALTQSLWRWSALVAMLGVWIYVAFVGAGVASVRAGIMVTVYLAAKVLDRRPHVGASIALAVIIILAASPHALWTPGFQLSVGAVVALVTLCPWLIRLFKINRLRSRLIRLPLEGVIATAVAGMATAPIVAYHFHQIPLWGFAANLLIGPYVTLVLMPLGFAVMVLGRLLVPLLTWAIMPMVAGIVWATPYAETAQWTPTLNWREKMPLQITFWDVGQGASVFLQFPNGETMLVDGGGTPKSTWDMGRMVLTPALLARGITQVDTLVLTHPHPDHYMGLAYIAEHFHPTQFWVNGSEGEEGDSDWQHFSERMAGVDTRIMHAGDHVQVGEVVLECLHPPIGGPNETLGKNNGSLVILVRYRGFKVLITGDVEKEAEAQLATTPPVGPVDVMQIPHHASRTSSTDAMLRWAQPKLGVAQLGRDNRYGFPHPEVVERYKAMGIPLYRTDFHGAVTIGTDGTTTVVIPAEAGIQK